MKKSSLFISAILTTFILTVLAGALSAYRTYAGSAAQQHVASVVAVTQRIAPVQPPVPVQSTATNQLRLPDISPRSKGPRWRPSG
jgi:hypothetical protein